MVRQMRARERASVRVYRSSDVVLLLLLDLPVHEGDEDGRQLPLQLQHP